MPFPISFEFTDAEGLLRMTGETAQIQRPHSPMQDRSQRLLNQILPDRARRPRHASSWIPLEVNGQPCANISWQRKVEQMTTISVDKKQLRSE